MDEETREIYSYYFCRSLSWFEQMPEDFFTSMVHAAIPVASPRFMRTVGEPIKTVLERVGPAVVRETEEYIADPTKCAKNPWTYHTMKHVPVVDLEWMRAVFDERTKDKGELMRKLTEGAEELSHPQPCFERKVIIRDFLTAMTGAMKEGEQNV